jgi:hypothetical protein
MSNNIQQTSIDWLEKENDKLFISYQKGFMSVGRFIFLQHKLFKQAKEMEKEQMIEFAKEVFICRYNGIQERLSNIANDIYNETYGGKNE